MSYIGLFSYDNFENWAYLPSYTSDNTPWFFNGIRMQIFTSDKLKIEPGSSTDGRSYGKFNEMPGFGAQISVAPVEWLSLISNDYVGWDTQDAPGRLRFHTRQQPRASLSQRTPTPGCSRKMAFSVTARLRRRARRRRRRRSAASGTRGTAPRRRRAPSSSRAGWPTTAGGSSTTTSRATVGGGMMRQPRPLPGARSHGRTAVRRAAEHARSPVVRRRDPFPWPGHAVRRVGRDVRLPVHARASTRS